MNNTEKRLPRRHFLRLAAGAGLVPAASRFARADNYPSRPVRLVVTVPAGGSPDIIGRLIAQWLSDKLGQPFVVENKPGASTNIGTELVLKSAPDGGTLLLAMSSNAINPALYHHLNFNFMRDAEPVASIATIPLVMDVNPAVPAKTLPDFIAYAKANPGKLNYASVGAGAATNVAGELFNELAGIKLVNVPYRNSYIPDLLSGQVQAGFTPILQTLGYIKAGKLRALAVTGVAHSGALPDVPNATQFVPGYDVAVWDAIGAPANTPPGIIDTLNTAINAALSAPKMRARFTDLGAEPMIMTPAELKQYMVEETKKWGRVVREAHIKPD